MTVKKFVLEHWRRYKKWVIDITLICSLIFAVEMRGHTGTWVIFLVITVFAAIPVYRLVKNWDTIKAQMDMVDMFREAEKKRRQKEKEEGE